MPEAHSNALDSKHAEKDECLFLDEGGLLTADEIQEKIALREAKRAEAKSAKEASKESKRVAKLEREAKKEEKKAKREQAAAVRALTSKLQAEAKAPAKALNVDEINTEVMIEV